MLVKANVLAETNVHFSQQRSWIRIVFFHANPLSMHQFDMIN